MRVGTNYLHSAFSSSSLEKVFFNTKYDPTNTVLHEQQVKWTYKMLQDTTYDGTVLQVCRDQTL